MIHEWQSCCVQRYALCVDALCAYYSLEDTAMIIIVHENCGAFRRL